MEINLTPLLMLALPAIPSSSAQARRAVRAITEGRVADLDGVDLAVSEAVTNAVVHAYRDRSDSEPPGEVRVTVTAATDALVVDVTDDGAGMRPRPDSPGLGLGLALMANVADHIDIQDDGDGTRVRMRFAGAE